ncbi:FAS1 domain-containing protein [Podospora fimiseda]|uniref:FAS1 domain-containing protein n=1 Tax=Podospora fimiseda TaxID=252190 RepID=A0AAN7BQ60_9PEZI|nr:FAS1 domain-containing protein [Podospora fimiseda]
MLSQTFLAGLGLFAVSASAQSLLSVLQNNGHTEFARLLQEEGAVIESVPGARLIVFAPPDVAISRNGDAIVARQTEGNQTKRALYNYAKETAPDLRRQTAKECAVWAYETLFSDPELVNLGPGRNQTIVQKDVGSAAVGVVFTGLGDSVKVTSSDIPFAGGVVRPIAGTLTLPRNLSATLPFLNVDRFEAALQRTGLLTQLDAKAKITVLAPPDSVFAKNASSLPDDQLAETLKRHILVNVAAYTPLLPDGAVFQTLGGTNVTVSLRGNEVYIGGALIVSGDAIITNGVVHTIDKFLPGSVTTPPPPLVTGAAAALRPMNLFSFALPVIMAVVGGCIL